MADNFNRTFFTPDELVVQSFPLSMFRTWDNRAVNLPATSSADDLGLTTGTLGTSHPSLRTADLKTAGATTVYAGISWPVSTLFDTDDALILRISAGMVTTAADTSATIDAQVYKANGDLTVSADLCATAAQSCNSTTFADLDFVITDAALSPGDLLDIRLALAVNDAASGTAVIGCIGSVKLVLSR